MAPRSACRSAGIFDFFRTCRTPIDIPIMIQDAPVSGTALSAPFLARMAKEIANVAYFKIEVPGAASKLRELIELGGRRDRGAVGRRGGHHAAPRPRCRRDGGDDRRRLSGRHPPDRRRLPGRAAARKPSRRYNRWLPLINYENRQTGLIAAKALMKEGGVIASEAVRHPLAAAASADPRRPDGNSADASIRWFCAGRGRAGMANYGFRVMVCRGFC